MHSFPLSAPAHVTAKAPQVSVLVSLGFLLPGGWVVSVRSHFSFFFYIFSPYFGTSLILESLLNLSAAGIIFSLNQRTRSLYVKRRK